VQPLYSRCGVKRCETFTGPGPKSPPGPQVTAVTSTSTSKVTQVPIGAALHGARVTTGLRRGGEGSSRVEERLRLVRASLVVAPARVRRTQCTTSTTATTSTRVGEQPPAAAAPAVPLCLGLPVLCTTNACTAAASRADRRLCAPSQGNGHRVAPRGGGCDQLTEVGSGPCLLTRSAPYVCLLRGRLHAIVRAVVDALRVMGRTDIVFR
jgi:hypothetical protein